MSKAPFKPPATFQAFETSYRPFIGLLVKQMGDRAETAEEYPRSQIEKDLHRELRRIDLEGVYLPKPPRNSKKIGELGLLIARFTLRNQPFDSQPSSVSVYPISVRKTAKALRFVPGSHAATLEASLEDLIVVLEGLPQVACNLSEASFMVLQLQEYLFKHQEFMQQAAELNRRCGYPRKHTP